MTTIQDLNPPDVLAALGKASKRTKYGNHRVMAHGYSFDSQVEMRRYEHLELLQALGEISQLQVHPAYEVLPRLKTKARRTNQAVKFKPDFSYRTKDGEWVVEDVKAPRRTKGGKMAFRVTTDFTIRRKLFQSKYPTALFQLVCETNREWYTEIF